MSQALATIPSSGEALERVLVGGDLSRLTPEQRVVYVQRVCESLGLNPLTRPFQYLRLSGKEVLYATRDCTEQLRKIHRVGITIAARERHDDLYVVTARATTPDGRTDESVGAVPLAGKKGEELANAIMKAETKAKRRVTLSICGLGMLDESEVDSIAAARPMVALRELPPAATPHDPETGEVLEPLPEFEAPRDSARTLMAEIMGTSSLDYLSDVGRRIKASKLSETEKAPLRKAFANKRGELEGVSVTAIDPTPAPPAVVEAPAVVEPAPGEPTRAAFERRLLAATSPIAADAMLNEAKEAFDRGELTKIDMGALRSAHKRQVVALEAAAKDAEDAEARALRDGFVAQIAAAPDDTTINRVLVHANERWSAGQLSKGDLVVAKEAAEARREALRRAKHFERGDEQ